MGIIKNCPQLGEQTSVGSWSLYSNQRLRPLAETWAWVAPHLAQVGITRVAELTGLDVLGVPVFTAVRPNAPMLAIAQGKGLTPLAAKLSAVMEAVEHHHAEQIHLPTRHAPAADLPHHLLAGLPVPANTPPPTAATPLAWAEGVNLFTGTAVWVPVGAIQISQLAGQPAPFLASTNGLAAGNHPLEAIRHALCELLERDALAEWRHQLGRVPLRVLDWDTVTDAPCQAVRAQITAAGATAAIWDMRGRWDVPAFGCVLEDTHPQLGWEPVGIFHGFGAHPHPATALLRALTEAVQSRLAYISGTRDDLFAVDYQLAQAAHVQTQWRHLLAQGTAVAWGTIPNHSTGDVVQEVDWLLHHVQATGLETAVWIDLTQPALGIPVGRLFIPGLRLAWAGK